MTDDPRTQAIEILLPGLAEHIASFREPDEDYSNRGDARWLAAWFLDAIPGDVHARLAADKGAKGMYDYATLVYALRDIHWDRHGYCNQCGGRYPCSTIRLVDPPRPEAGT